MRSLLTTVAVLACSLAPGAGAATDVVLEWNAAALDLIRKDNVPPPAAARNLAMLHAAIYDAVNGIVRTHAPYAVRGSAPTGALPEAAATAAARRVLIELHPSRRTEVEAIYAKSLAGLRDGPRHRRRVAWGTFVAETILRLRADDGANVSAVLPPSDPQPGQWRPTLSFGGVVRPALLPHWGSVIPFAVRDVARFRPPPAPPLASCAYAEEVGMVRAIGGATSDLRTDEETEIARFWAYGPGTATPPGHWNEIAQAVAEAQENTLPENARLFALLNLALADAAIVCWECKYAYNFWRPITAIREAHLDGNPSTVADPDWLPLIPTPPFPEYVSGHSTFSGAAAVVLVRFFGRDAMPFAVGSDDLPGVFRSYARFSDAAYESGLSRIYGGIHFMSANIHGLITGAAVGEQVFASVLRPVRRPHSHEYKCPTMRFHAPQSGVHHESKRNLRRDPGSVRQRADDVQSCARFVARAGVEALQARPIR